MNQGPKLRIAPLTLGGGFLGGRLDCGSLARWAATETIIGKAAGKNRDGLGGEVKASSGFHVQSLA